mmetsp:Transcript_102642/g.209099  ORF Transcript_102642/g.209099 Transcript_102642/m.209099 type:complete len:357 (-) Transcript_102642:50-1120(-)
MHVRPETLRGVATLGPAVCGTDGRGGLSPRRLQPGERRRPAHRRRPDQAPRPGHDLVHGLDPCRQEGRGQCGPGSHQDRPGARWEGREYFLCRRRRRVDGGSRGRWGGERLLQLRTNLQRADTDAGPGAVLRHGGPPCHEGGTKQPRRFRTPRGRRPHRARRELEAVRTNPGVHTNRHRRGCNPRCRWARPPREPGGREGLLRPTDGLCGLHRRHDHHAGGNLRSRLVHSEFRYGSRGPGDRQRYPVRADQLRSHPQRCAPAPDGTVAAFWDGGNERRLRRFRKPFWWRQGKWVRPRGGDLWTGRVLHDQGHHRFRQKRRRFRRRRFGARFEGIQPRGGAIVRLRHRTGQRCEEDI